MSTGSHSLDERKNSSNERCRCPEFAGFMRKPCFANVTRQPYQLKVAVSKNHVLTRYILWFWFQALQAHPTIAQWQQ